METLAQLLPIIIYFLLIIVIIVGIILGIKLIIAIDKTNEILDDVNTKVEKITPLFDTVGFVSNMLNGIVGSVVNTAENVISNVFHKKKERKMEDEDE